MRLHIALALSCLVTSPVIAQNAARAADDEAAVREVVRKYVDAREKQDPKLIAAVFTPDADQFTTSGEWRRGRDNVVKGALASSQGNPGTRQIIVEAVRFPVPGVAIADGRYEIRAPQGGDPPSLSKPPDTSSGEAGARRMWTTLIVIRDGAGEWRISAIRNMVPTGAAR